MAVLKGYDTRSIRRRCCEVDVSVLAREEHNQSKEWSEFDEERTNISWLSARFKNSSYSFLSTSEIPYVEHYREGHKDAGN
jgi:hypothetical protein